MEIPTPLVIFVFTALAVLSGCGGPVIQLTKPYKDIDDQITRGRTTRDQVHALLGEPYLANPDRKSEMYTSEGKGMGYVFIIPVHAGYLHYLIIDYDETERVRSLRRGVMPLNGGHADTHRSKLANMLYIPEYQTKRQRQIVLEREQLANAGDPEAQMQLYYSNPYAPDALRWLCRSADQSHPHAMNELATYYWTGRRGIEQDLTRAYLWYSLAVRAGHEEYRWKLREVAGSITHEQRARAEEMLADWRPGQCERDLRMGQHED
jgi:TPR repeat protein